MDHQSKSNSDKSASDSGGLKSSVGILGTLREALLGSHHDFTEGSIGRAIFLLSVPMVLEMAMESLFGVVNVFWVSHLGREQTAAVGITESLLTIVFTVALGLSMGTTAIVARRVGEKDFAGAAGAAAQSIIIGITVSIPIAVIGIVFYKSLFGLMNAEPGVITQGKGYINIIFGANVIIMLLFLINAIFRGAGDAAIAMQSLWVGNIINLILDPCLIFGLGPFPELGVTGSAVATTIGRSCAVIFQFSRLFGGHSRIPIKPGLFHPDFHLIGNLVRISLGGTLQYLVATAAWMMLMSVVGKFGSAAQAGYTIALRIIVVTILPSWGMSNAAATLVGQNLGADKPLRAEKSVWVAGHSNAIFLGSVSLIFIFFAGFLVRIFTSDSSVIPFGVDALRYISYGYIFYAYGMVMVASFNGAGDTLTPTLLNLICFWLIQIPLAYSLSLWFGFGARGVFIAITVAESILAVFAVLFFRRGKWRERMV